MKLSVFYSNLTEAAERSGTPILVVQGANDTVLDEGARLYTKLEKSGADNARLLLLTDEDHSGHSDVLFSEESAALRNEITDRDSGKNTEDPDTVPKIKDPVDPAALNAPNTELLDTILRFFEEAGEPDKGGTKE